MSKRHRGLGTWVARFIVVTFTWLSLTASVASAGGLPCQYDVTAVIDSPFADDIVRGEAINNHDEVCGYYSVGFSSNRAFYWTPKGGFVTIPTPSGVFESVAHDVSDAGLVVGVMRFSGSAIGNKGFIHEIRTGQTTFLESEDEQGQCEITGVNESGVVCGFRSINDGGDVFVPTTAFRWSAPTGFEDMTPKGYSQAFDINESSVCTGWYGFLGIRRAFLWGNGNPVSMPMLDGGVEDEGQALNEFGIIVGRSVIPNPQPPPLYAARATLWSDDGTVLNLGTQPGFPHSFALDVAADRTIVGYVHQGNNSKAVAWNGPVFRSLTDQVVGFRGYVDQAWGINSSGRILANGSTDPPLDQTLSVILTPQPPLSGDANGSCTVNVEDLLLVIKQWGQDGFSPADLDDSELVDVRDLLIVLDSWTF